MFVLLGVINSLCLDTVSARMGVGHFAVAGPTAWNSLSDDLCDPTLSTDSFRRLLKTSEYTQISHFMRYINTRLTYLKLQSVTSDTMTTVTHFFKQSISFLLTPQCAHALIGLGQCLPRTFTSSSSRRYESTSETHTTTH